MWSPTCKNRVRNGLPTDLRPLPPKGADVGDTRDVLVPIRTVEWQLVHTHTRSLHQAVVPSHQGLGTVTKPKQTQSSQPSERGRDQPAPQKTTADRSSSSGHQGPYKRAGSADTSLMAKMSRDLQEEEEPAAGWVAWRG